MTDVLAELNEIVATEGAKETKDDDNNDDDPSGGVKGKAKRANKKSAPTAAVEQQTMLTKPNRAESTPPARQTAVEPEFVETNETVSEENPAPVAQSEAPALPNKGTVLMDATCAPADVAYPTDLNLLNKAREKLEAIIDTLHQPVIGKTAKPRTYREKARKQFLAVSKQRRPGPKVIRKAIRRQLSYVGRNLDIIAEQAKDQPLTLLSRRAYRDLQVIHELYRQQLQMYNEHSHQIEDRIISIHQPHVRPIVRGKAKARVEFGAKIAVSMSKGLLSRPVYPVDQINISLPRTSALENNKKSDG